METKTADKVQAPPPEASIAWEIPCWLCESIVEVRFSKKNRPYVICDNCGIQVFVRYGKAEDLLVAKIKQYQGQKGR